MWWRSALQEALVSVRVEIVMIPRMMIGWVMSAISGLYPGPNPAWVDLDGFGKIVYFRAMSENS